MVWKPIDLWVIETTERGLIVCQSHDELNKCLAKLGNKFRRVRHMAPAQAANSKRAYMCVRTRELEMYRKRAKDLGLPSVNTYLRFVIRLDCELDIFKKATDFIGQSKYNYSANPDKTIP